MNKILDEKLCKLELHKILGEPYTLHSGQRHASFMIQTGVRVVCLGRPGVSDTNQLIDQWVNHSSHESNHENNLQTQPTFEG